MISIVIADRCTGCGTCVAVCPTNVFDATPEGLPRIARQEDCQTCFTCELYCPADALYVAADVDRAEPVAADEVIAVGLVGVYRRDSGWDEWSGDPRFVNEHWRMEQIFGRARELAEAQAAEAPAPRAS